MKYLYVFLLGLPSIFIQAQHSKWATRPGVQQAIRNSFSQNLIGPIKLTYFEDQYDYLNDYSTEFVLKYKIKSISERRSNSASTEYQFNKSGKPYYKKYTDNYGDSIVTRYQYDSSGNVLSKTIYQRLSSLYSKYAISHVFEWAYDEGGVLLEQCEYAMVDYIPGESGGVYFSPEMMAVNCLTYTYDTINEILLINNSCKNTKHRIYPFCDSVKNQIRLKFFENGNVSEKTQVIINRGNKRKTIRKYDLQGNEIYGEDDSTVFSKDWIFPRSYAPLERNRVLRSDTIKHRKTGDLEIHYTIASSNERIELLKLKYDPLGSLKSEALYWYASDKKDTLFSFQMSKYEKGRVAHKEHYTSHLSPLNFSGYHNSSGYHPAGELYSKATFRYFSNGLLREVISYDRAGIETGHVYYKIEYNK